VSTVKVAYDNFFYDDNWTQCIP